LSDTPATQRLLLLAAAFLATALAVCSEPESGYLPADRTTRPGERLWLVTISTPGASAADMDTLVADPFLRALRADGRVEVTAMASRPGRLDTYIRAPVHVSSVLVVGLALGSITMPNGTLQPGFEAAGPPPLDVTRPRIDWALRIEGEQPATISERLAEIAAVLESNSESGGHLALVPSFTSDDRFALPDMPHIIRVGGQLWAAYLLGTNIPENAARRTAARAGIDPGAVRRVSGMSDAERALLGWPAAPAVKGRGR